MHLATLDVNGVMREAKLGTGAKLFQVVVASSLTAPSVEQR